MKRLQSRRFAFGLMVTLSVLLGTWSTAVAQEAPEDGKWKNSWTANMWVPGFNGDATVRGIPVNVDVSVSDAIDLLDKMEASFSGHYEGNKKPYGVIVDINYWQLECDFTSRLGHGSIKPSSLILELAGSYTLSEKMMGGFAVQRVQGLFGARYNQLKLEAEFTPEGEEQVEGSRDQSFVDPFIGARIYQAVSRQWGGNLRVDVGGFGVSSDLTLNVVATFGYNISPKKSILLGWRYYSVDYKNGSGADEFKWDIAQSGPFIAFQSRF